MSHLVIETTDRAGGAALYSTANDCRMTTWPEGTRHGEVLWPSIQELMKDHDWTDLEGIIAGVGPGRLTGVRVGLVVAKTICLTHRLPLVLVDRFEQIAFDASAKTEGLISLLPLMGTRLAAQRHRREEGRWVAESDPSFFTQETLQEGLRGMGISESDTVDGPLPSAVQDQISHLFPASAPPAWSDLVLGDVKSLAAVGLEKAKRGQMTPLQDVRPIYYA